MIQTEHVGQILILAKICISFFIFVFDRRVKDTTHPWNYISYCFLIPVVLLSTKLILVDMPVSRLFAGIADTILSLALIVAFVRKDENRWFKSIKAIPFMLLALVLFTGFYTPAPAYFDIAEKSYPFVLLCATILMLILTGKLYGRKNTFFAAFIFLGAEGLNGILKGYSGVTHGFSLISYICFAVFLTGKSIEVLQDRVKRAEKRLAELDRSLEPEIKKRTIYFEKLNENLIEISRTDPLSKALNKAAIIEEIERLIRVKVPEFSILMFDIDDFKSINDNKGHIEGDKYIYRLSHEARSCLRKVDMLGRYGGDEFIAVLPGLPLKQAWFVAERLRKRVEDSHLLGFTISVGIASFPEDGQTAEELITFADKGLYVSKKKGKNNVTHWSEDMEHI